MKGKLIKENDYHYYLSIDGKIIADINAHPLSSINVSKLSKQNCDEIFGVVDVEKLADDEVKNLPKGDERLQRWYGFINGFNKRDELNKDKVFTLEDMKRAIDKAKQGSVKETHNGYGRPTEPIFVLDDLSYDEIIQSIQHPTEIEVEIIMSPCYYDTSLGGFSTSYTEGKPIEEPKLDKDGCMILKRVQIHLNLNQNLF